jgi:hypothetical protein
LNTLSRCAGGFEFFQVTVTVTFVFAGGAVFVGWRASSCWVTARFPAVS